jgi:hypothetical protein
MTQLQIGHGVQRHNMKTTIAVSSTVITLLIAISQVNAGIIVGPIANPDNGHDYYLLTPGTWTASEAEAENLGGTLAIIRNSAEQDWIFSTFGSYGGVTNRSLWIGLRRDWQGGPFAWVNGEPLKYTNWSLGEPDNLWWHERYVHMWSSSMKYPGGKWNDASDDVSFYGLIPNGVVEVPREEILTENEKSLIGTWYEGGRIDRPCYFAGTTNMLFAIGHSGRSARIVCASANHVFAASWHTSGEIVQDKILWSDGTWWSRKASNYTSDEVSQSEIEIR